MSDFNRGDHRGVPGQPRGGRWQIRRAHAGAAHHDRAPARDRSGSIRWRPWSEDDTLYVFASKAGAPTNPDWYHNLLAHPEVEVEFGDDRFDAVASPVTGPERDRIYAAQVERHAGFRRLREGHRRGSSRSWSCAARPEPGRPFSPSDRRRVRGGGCSGSTASGGRADYYLADLARELPYRMPGHWAGGAAAAARSGGSAHARGLPAAAPGTAPAHRAADGIGADQRGGVRPDVQRPEVGQRALRSRRRGGGRTVVARCMPRRWPVRCATWSSTASRQCGGRAERSWSRPRGWSPGSSPTGSIATATPTCTATS